jgi:hypothetical protein
MNFEKFVWIKNPDFGRDYLDTCWLLTLTLKNFQHNLADWKFDPTSHYWWLGLNRLEEMFEVQYLWRTNNSTFPLRLDQNIKFYVATNDSKNSDIQSFGGTNFLHSIRHVSIFLFNDLYGDVLDYRIFS